MREILFRGKRMGDNEWVYGLLARYGDNTSNIVESKFELLVPVETKTVGQWAGLCDKNGVKVFEGDVVKVKDALNWGTSGTFIGSVGFGDASFRIETDTSTHYRWQDYDCEVIGNVHDNPELLKEEAQP